MPTVCEMQIEAKKRGLRGWSRLRKAQLEQFLANNPGNAARNAARKSKGKKRAKANDSFAAQLSNFPAGYQIV